MPNLLFTQILELNDCDDEIVGVVFYYSTVSPLTASWPTVNCH